MTIDEIAAVIEFGTSSEGSTATLESLRRLCATAIHEQDEKSLTRIAKLSEILVGGRIPNVPAFLGFCGLSSLAKEVTVGRRSLRDALAELEAPDMAPLMSDDVVSLVLMTERNLPGDQADLHRTELELAATIARRTANGELLATVATFLGTLIGFRDVNAAIAWYREGLAVEGPVAPRMRAMLFHNFAYLALRHGCTSELIEIGRQTLEAVGDDPARYFVLLALCEIYDTAGDDDRQMQAATALASVDPKQSDEARRHAIAGLLFIAGLHRKREEFRLWNAVLNRALDIAVAACDWTHVEAVARRLRSFGASRHIYRLPRVYRNLAAVPPNVEAWLVHENRNAMKTERFDREAVPAVDPAMIAQAVETLLERAARAIDEGVPFEALLFARVAATWCDERVSMEAVALEAEAWFEIGHLRRAAYCFSAANGILQETLSDDSDAGVVAANHPKVATMIRLTYNTGICNALLNDTVGRAMAGLSSVVDFAVGHDHHDIAIEASLAINNLGLIHDFVETAVASGRQALETARRHGTVEQKKAAAFWFGTSLCRADAQEDAARVFLEAAGLAEDTGDEKLVTLARRGRFMALHAAAGQHLRRQQTESGQRLLQAALDEVRWAPYESKSNIAAVLRAELGAARLQGDDLDGAREMMTAAIEELRAAGQIDVLIATLSNLMQVERKAENEEKAEQFRLAAVGAAEEHGRPEWAVQLRRAAPSAPAGPAEAPIATDTTTDILDQLVPMIVSTASDVEAAAIVMRLARDLDPDAIDHVWARLQHFQRDASRVLRALADAAPPRFSRADLARCLIYAARIEQMFGSAMAFALYERALALVTPSDDPRLRFLESECVGGLGAAFGLRGEHRRAIEYFSRAVDLRRELGLEERLAAALGNLAANYIDMRDARPAVALYEEALDLRLKHNNRSGAVTALCSLARLDAQFGSVGKALARLDRARALAQGDVDEEAKVLSDRINLLEKHRNAGEARGVAIELERIAAGNPQRLTEASMCRARLELRAGRPDQAIEHATRARDIANEADWPTMSARASVLIAAAQAEGGRRDEAVAALEGALSAARIARLDPHDIRMKVAWGFWSITGSPRALELTLDVHREAVESGALAHAAEALAQAGLIAWYRGELLTARDYLTKALALEEQAVGKRRPSTLDALAITLRDLGEYSTALAMLTESAVARPEPNIETIVYFAMQFSALDDPDRGVSMIDEAIGLALARGDRSQLAFTYAMAAAVLRAAGFMNIAVVRAEQARDIYFYELHDDIHGLQALLPLADALHSAGRNREAEQTYLQALEIADRYALRHLGAVVANNVGVLYREAGRLDDAMTHFEQAGQLAGNDFRGVLSQALANQAHLLYDEKQYDEAYARAIAAVDLEEDIRRDLEPAHRFAIRSDVGARVVTAAFIAAALHQDEQAWNLAERAHARVLAEDVTGRVTSFGDVKSVLREIDERVVIVEYTLTQTEILITVASTTEDRPVIRVVPLDFSCREIVDRAVERVHAGDDPSIISELDTLSDVLLAPIADVMGASDVVAFAPDGVLWFVPFPLLMSGGRCLIESRRIVLVPNAAILRGDARPVSAVARPLVIGDPNGDLRFARREAIHVAALLDTAPLLGEAATVQRVTELLADASLVHFGGHAFYDENEPSRSGVRLADGVLTARDLVRRRVSSPFVVLSGCSTGRIGAVGGGEIGGLAGALLAAGSRTVISSQWTISDAAAVDVMEKLYAALQRGENIGAALSGAIPSSRAFATTPFVMIGDWRTRFARYTYGS